MFPKTILLLTVSLFTGAVLGSSIVPQLDPRFCDPSLTSPFYTGYRLRTTVSMSPNLVRSVFLYLDKCEDGKFISSIPFQLQEDPKGQRIPVNQLPFTKLFCSGITCYKIGRTREAVLREQTSIQLEPGQTVGGLFFIAEGDGLQDKDLEPVAPLLREDVTHVFLTSLKDEIGKVYKQIHIPLLYTLESEASPTWYNEISGNEKYILLEESKQLFRDLFDKQVIPTLKRYLKVYNKRIQHLFGKIADEKPIRRAMKSVTTEKLSKLDITTVTLLKEKIDSLAKHRVNIHFLDYETIFTLSKILPHEEMKKFARQVDNIYAKIPIYPFTESPIHYPKSTTGANLI